MLLAAALVALTTTALAADITGSRTYRSEVRGRHGVVATGRNLSAEAGLRMLARGGNAIDAGVAATFAAAVTEISHFGLGGEVPILIYAADRRRVVVINGQGTAPAAASVDVFKSGGIPTNGPSAGTVPAVVDALCLALAEFGTLSLGEVLEPAIALADRFPWDEFLARYLGVQLDAIRRIPSGAAVYLQGADGGAPAVGQPFRQPELARTLRALVEEEARHRHLGRAAAIGVARDRFYRGDIGQRIARAVQDAGGLMTAADLANYRGRVEEPTRFVFRTGLRRYEVFKTGFWGQGPVLLQALALLDAAELVKMGPRSADYVHTVAEALKLALADRDAFYGDPDVAKVPAHGLLSPAYAAERRRLIDRQAANNQVRPGDPWRFEPTGAATGDRRTSAGAGADRMARIVGAVTSPFGARPVPAASPDTTTVNVSDAKGNLFSASPSSAWFTGGVFIAGDTGVPLGNRMQAFALDAAHPNGVRGGKRPRTTLTPTIVLRDGAPFLALSSVGGDSQDQQALQVFLNIALFNLAPQEAVEAPRFNSLHYQESFGARRFRMPGGLEIEDRVPPDLRAELQLLGHTVLPVGAFAMDTGTSVAGFDAMHGTVFGAADVRRQRFVVGW